MKICPNCGEENSERARFCQACASPLDEQSEPREERKIVTVLFCDLVGSTARAEAAGSGRPLPPSCERLARVRRVRSVARRVETGSAHAGDRRRCTGREGSTSPNGRDHLTERFGG
jgi:hypothetical protein